MRVTMIGSAYVGLVSGAGFANCGPGVMCDDMDAGKIDRLQSGRTYKPDDMRARGFAQTSVGRA